MRIAIVLVLALFGAAFGGCSAAVTPKPCPVSLLTGTLVEQGEELIVVGESLGPPDHLAWPDGYSVARRNGVLAVLDPSGAIKANAGDAVSLGGARVEGRTFMVCGEIVVTSPAPT